MGEYANTRPDSQKGQVYAAFKAGGEAAAWAKAKELGVPQRCARWIRLFGGDPDKGHDGAATAKPSKPAEKAPVEAAKPITEAKPMPRKAKAPVPRAAGESRRRVFDVGTPDIHGTVVEPGPEVSGVRFDGDREVHYIGNVHLRDVDDEPSERDRYAFMNAEVFRVMRKAVIVDTAMTFEAAMKAAGDDTSLWLFAVSKGGTVALMQRCHWAQYQALGKRTKKAA
jgi:hypothetical protein